MDWLLDSSIEPWEGLVVINGVPMYQAHNALLDVWVQLGVVGLVAMIWLLIQSFIRLWRIAVRHTSPLYLYPLFIFLVITAQSITESRLLIEISWVLLVLVSVKSREGFSDLEPWELPPSSANWLGISKEAERNLES